ncbi:CBS domain-containing protein [Infirmifilum uzonense]|uniref:CBS domain-containing protein n=1 Tax=Infirmifilum uzonense TaxID=1550241 RepID=UPI003C71529E
MSLSSTLYELLVAVVTLFDSLQRPVTSSEIATHLGKSEGTVRNSILALKAMGLIEARTGPGGGYFPTVKGIEIARSPQYLENLIEPTPIVIDSHPSRIYALELDILGLADPAGVKAVLKVFGSINQLREGAHVKLGPTPRTRLIIDGYVLKVDYKRHEILIEVNSLIAVPKATAGEVMTPSPVVVKRSVDLTAVGDLLLSNDIRAIPVVDDDGKLCGIISASHVVKAYLRRDYKGKVEDFMETNVPRVGTGADIMDLMKILASRKTGRAVVVDELERPVGIVTRTDVLNKLVRYTLSYQ